MRLAGNVEGEWSSVTDVLQLACCADDDSQLCIGFENAFNAIAESLLSTPYPSRQGAPGCTSEGTSPERIPKCYEFARRETLLGEAFKALNKRERHIFLECRLKSSPSTLDDLSQRFGISRERVRQIEDRASKKLHVAMSAAEAPNGLGVERQPVKESTAALPSDAEVAPTDSQDTGSIGRFGAFAAITSAALVTGAVVAAATSNSEAHEHVAGLRPTYDATRYLGADLGSTGTDPASNEACSDLPRWLLELDQVQENTVIHAKKLTDSGCGRPPTDDDAIVLLGHLVQRRTAYEAAMYLSLESLVNLVLHKRALHEMVCSWLSGNVTIKPVSNFDHTSSEQFAKLLEDELCKMPFWDRSPFRRRHEALKALVEQAVARYAAVVAIEASATVSARSAAVWPSRKYPRSGRFGRNYSWLEKDSYERAVTRYSEAVARCDAAIARYDAAAAAGREALQELSTGKSVKARNFLTRFGEG